MDATLALPGLVPMLGPSWLDPEYLINDVFGPWALAGTALIIFIETGLLFPFLPGDSLLFTAGLMTAGGVIAQPLWLVCLVFFAAALAGDQAGYAIGRFAGPRIFKREDSRVFKQSYIDQTYAFFDKYGGRAIVLARASSRSCAPTSRWPRASGTCRTATS